MPEGSESSSGLTSVDLGQDVATLSPEDIAWADSCLSTEPDTTDSGWNSLKAALLETLDSQNNSSPYYKEISPLVSQSPAKEIHPVEDINNMYDSDSTPVSIASTSEEPESKGDDHLNHENADDFWSKHKMEDVFLPTYNENLRDLGRSDPEVNFIFQEFRLDQSTEDVFKVWDFDIPPEENDLMKELNKALEENPAPPVSDDYEARKGLQGESLDDLISGIADLALSPKSGQHFFRRLT